MDLENILKSEDYPELFTSLQDIKKFCSETWANGLLPWFTNHNCEHSREIVHILGQILQPLEGHAQFLNEHELFALLSSAYLHDIGMQNLKVEDISIDKLTEEEYNLIRKRHAQASYDIILKNVSEVLVRDDFYLPNTIDEEYLPLIARISKGHSTDYFEEVVAEFKEDPLTPKGREARGELLTALLMIADELDLQCKRVDFSEIRKFELSSHSKLHWFKHHYVDFVNVENAAVSITLKFPRNADGYSELICELIRTKLEKQIGKINHILSDSTSGILHLNPAINLVKKEDKTGVKRIMPDDALDELKKVLEKASSVPSSTTDAAEAFYVSTIPKPSNLFTGRTEELERFKKAFDSANFISIEGLGGIGKTEFAAKCIEKYVNDDKVVWFECLADSTLDALINCAGYPDVLKGENKTELAKYSGFSDLIERDEKVIFLDNYQDVIDASFKNFSIFSERRLCKAIIILIDRASPDAGVRVAPVEICGLSDDSSEYANKLIDTYYNDVTVSDTDINNICDKVDGHPLAIELAIQLLRYGETPDNIISKIVQAKDKSKQLSDKLLDEIFNHPKSTEEERNFMLRFSVFRGEVDRSAFSFIMEEIDMSETLRRLQDKKMVMRSATSK